MKRMNFPGRKDNRRKEAEARQASYSPDPTKYGLRQKVKVEGMSVMVATEYMRDAKEESGYITIRADRWIDHHHFIGRK